MQENIIKFHSCHISNNEDKSFVPIPVKNYIPKWFREKDKYKKHGDNYELKFANINGKAVVHRMPTWKSCPALVDIFTTGYYFLTPCDITFTKAKEKTDHVHHDSCTHGQIDAPLDLDYDAKWGSVHSETELGHFRLSQPICRPRSVEEGFPTPDGYYDFTYTWFSNYFVQVPEGYTVLFTHPMNINDLPFRTVSGFNDASNFMTGPGNLPFHIKKDWEGTIPAGTPYAQIIPIKNESWTSEIVDYTEEQMAEYLENKHKEYMLGHGITKYKELDWLKKHYE